MRYENAGEQRCATSDLRVAARRLARKPAANFRERSHVTARQVRKRQTSSHRGLTSVSSPKRNEISLLHPSPNFSEKRLFGCLIFDIRKTQMVKFLNCGYSSVLQCRAKMVFRNITGYQMYQEIFSLIWYHRKSLDVTIERHTTDNIMHLHAFPRIAAEQISRVSFC